LGAGAADREARFAEVASALAVPLREDPDRVHLTCLSSSTDRWLLLETPEPMDFTEEITLDLARRVIHEVVPIAERTRLGALIEAALRRLVVPPGLLGMLDVPGSRRPVYSARLERNFLQVTDLRTDVVSRVRAPALSPEDRVLLADVTLDLNAALQIIRWRTPTTVEWVPTPITVIQNAPASQALLLPGAGGVAAGYYRLRLSITRRWFDTLVPLTPGSAYLETGALEFDLP
jgi:hypothetical protein